MQRQSKPSAKLQEFVERSTSAVIDFGYSPALTAELIEQHRAIERAFCDVRRAHAEGAYRTCAQLLIDAAALLRRHQVNENVRLFAYLAAHLSGRPDQVEQVWQMRAMAANVERAVN